MNSSQSSSSVLQPLADLGSIACVEYVMMVAAADRDEVRIEIFGVVLRAKKK